MKMGEILPLSGLFLITPSSGRSNAEIYKQHVNKLYREMLQKQSMHSRTSGKHQDTIMTEFRRRG